MEHIMGEHENNPNTGSAAEAMGGAGLEMGAPGGGAPPGLPNINPMGLAADTAVPQVQGADLQPTNFAQSE